MQIKQTVTHILPEWSYLTETQKRSYLLIFHHATILEEIDLIAIFTYMESKICLSAAVQCYAIVTVKKWIK